MIAARHDPFGGGLSRRRLATGVAIAAIVIVGLAASLGTTLRTSSAVLLLAWCAAWIIGAGMAGWHARSWLWTGILPAAMLVLILLRVALFGHAAWTSALSTVLGTMYAVAASIGAVLGTWFGQRRDSPA